MRECHTLDVKEPSMHRNLNFAYSEFCLHLSRSAGGPCHLDPGLVDGVLGEREHTGLAASTRTTMELGAGRRPRFESQD